VTAPTAGLRRLGEAGWRAVDWNHPEWWVFPMIGGAWLALGAAAVGPLMSGTTTATSGYSTLFVCPIPASAAIASGGVAALLVAVAGSVAMIVAMMGPLALPALHHVGLSGLWSRRRRGPAIVLAGFVATWLPAVWLIDGIVGGMHAAAGPPVTVAVVVGVAAVWHLTRHRARWLAACTRTSPIAPRGWRADVGCLRQGFVVARACVPSCAGPMLVVAAAGHAIVVMALIATVAIMERSARRPRTLRGVLASIVVAAVVMPGVVLGA
jgi:hypothetical protein